MTVRTTQPSIPQPRSVEVEALVRRTGDLLAAGVPLTLLLDIADSEGPHSGERFTAEGGDADWLPGH